MVTPRASGRVFLFGKYREINQTAIPRGLGFIDPDFDALDEAEIQVRRPATRPTEDRGS